MSNITARFLTIILLGAFLNSQSQNVNPEVSIIVKKGNRTFDLKKYDNVKITQRVVRNGVDSLWIVVAGDSIIKNRNILLVRPWYISEDRLAVDNLPSSKRVDYNSTNIQIRIPINEIEKMTIKRQPFSLIMSSLVAVSVIGILGGMTVPTDTKTNINVRNNIISTSYAVFIPSLALRLIFGSKRIRMNQNPTSEKTWKFQ